MGCKAVAQCVTACRLGYVRFPHRLFNRPLQCLFGDMVLALLVRTRVTRTLGRREHILPAPFAAGPGNIYVPKQKADRPRQTLPGGPARAGPSLFPDVF